MPSVQKQRNVICFPKAMTNNFQISIYKVYFSELMHLESIASLFLLGLNTFDFQLKRGKVFGLDKNLEKNTLWQSILVHHVSFVFLILLYTLYSMQCCAVVHLCSVGND